MAAVVLMMLLLLLLLPASTAYFFEDGFSHHYTYSAESNIFGMKNISTVLKFHIHSVNTTDQGHRLHYLEVDSFVQFTSDGLFRNNPKNWDLSKHFLFETSDDGTINLVHFHPEDEKELLIIKKALASLFSVKVQLSDENEWKYNTTENDHLGELKHEYFGVKTSTGMTLKRHHHSSDSAHRYHEKVLHYDHRGTVHAATVHDSVILKDTQNFHKERKPEPGEYIHHIDTSGEIPDIHTSAQVHVKLESKRHIGNKLKTADGLIPGTLLTEQKKEKKRLHEVRSDIEKFTQCIHNISDITDANRSECIHNLRKLLQNMHESDYIGHVGAILNKTCSSQNVRCLEKRIVYIDLVAHLGDPKSQEVILKEVLNVPDPDEDEIRRVFIHCIVIMHPTENFIQAIERFCTGENGMLHGSLNLTLTQKRACLALGSLAKNIAKKNTGEAERLIEKIETWIEKHEKANVSVRMKRSVPLIEINSEEEEYILGRTTLIHSLGNAGLKRSLPLIRSHLHPNPAHHAWKRAAVSALRHYTCTESALALFESALFDQDATVRKMAIDQYKKHPKNKELTAAHRDIVLGQNYNYPNVMRVRRGVLDKILLEFKLQIPPLNWNKDIGSKNVGASFGVKVDNHLQALFRPLSGFVDINVDDKLFAQVHVGFINKLYDVFLFEVCYKGRLEYNMNIFKDFSVNLAKDIASSFDKMTDKMMKPMVDAANHMSSQFQDLKTSSQKDVFEPFATATKDIPALTGNALDAALHLTDIAHQFSGLPWMTKFKEFVDSTQSLVEDVHSEALDFYHKISDAAMVALPFAEKEIRDATSEALGLIHNISDSPKQAFQALEQTRLKFQLAMARVLKSNSIINEATSLLKGDKSSWMSVGREIGSVIHMLQTAHNKLQQKSRKRRNADFLAQFKARFQNVGHSVENGMTAVQNAVDSLVGHLTLLQNHAPKQFQDASDVRQLSIATLQAGFEAFKQAVEKVKTTIHGLFGNKFHKSFPSQRRGCDDQCGCGHYPTDTCKKYKTPGIDLIWESNSDWQVPCPVNSMVTKLDSNTLLFQPVGSDLSNYEILISNIKPNETLFGKSPNIFVEAGQDIGYAAGNSGCNEEHIHVSVNKKSQIAGCFYVDPSPFLDSVKIMPKWTQKCRDYTLKYIGQTAGVGGLTQGFKDIFKELVREAVKYAAGLVMKEILKSGIVPPSIMSSVQSFISLYDDVIHGADDLGQLFSNIGEHMKHFFGNIQVGGISLNDAIHMLNPTGVMKDAVSALQAVVSKADDILNAPPAKLLKSCSSGLVGKLLTKLDLPKIGGKLASVAFIKASSSKLCPSFKNGLARGFGHACSADDDCLGVICEIKIPFLIISKTYNIGFRVYPEDNQTVLFAGDNNITINGSISMKIVSPGIHIKNFTLKLKMSVTYNHPTVNVSVAVIICKKNKCLPEIPILKDLRFKKTSNHVRTKSYVTHTTRRQNKTTTTLHTTTTTTPTRTTITTTHTTSPSTHKTTTATYTTSTSTQTTTSARKKTKITTLKTRSVSFKTSTPKPATHITKKGKTKHSTLKTTKSNKHSLTFSTKTHQPGHKTPSVHFKTSTPKPAKHTTLKSRTKHSTRKPSHGHRTSKHNSHRPTRRPHNHGKNRPNGSSRKRQGRLKALGKKSMKKISKLASSLNQKFHSLIDHMNKMRQSIRDKLSNRKNKPKKKFDKELKNPRFKTDKGVFPARGKNSDVNLEFFFFEGGFPVGPFLFTIKFNAGGVLKAAFDIEVDSVKSSVKAVFTPWVAGKMEADMSVNLGVAEGGISLIGYLMKTKFPLTLEVNYAKLPVKQIKSLAVELIPLELKLSAFVKALFFIDIHKTLWHWTAPSLKHTIFKKIETKKDDTSPEFPSCARICQAPRKDSSHCTVKQLKDRHPVDTAFTLEISADDDSSDLTLHYAVGTHPGGHNVIQWTQMRGLTVTNVTDLPNGIPLFWTVSIKNSQGLTSFARCHLDTYDNTVPDGRVEASYEYTSHPNKISATMVVFDDSPLLTQHNISLGYSPGQHGKEVVDDEPFQLDLTHIRSDVANELKYFSPSRQGKLTSQPIHSSTKPSDVLCAQDCIAYGKKCVSFDYEFHTQTCDLHDVIEGPSSNLRISGSYYNYERLGTGYRSFKEYSLHLEHGVRYYINAHIYNTLGYTSYLQSKGTLVDFTPPEPGLVQNVSKDEFVYDACHAAVTQRCKELTRKPNHRKIIDGPGSKTVFNGHKPLQETLYTMSNNYISANWDGFHDDESGVWGYTWAAGTQVCGSDIAAFSDPFSNLASPKFWTYSGFAKDLVLPDGKYYVTTQAINSIVHGGALVTTVCHSTPVTIDTSPPVFHEVSDLLFDEDFDMMGVYYNISDPGSGIANVDFGLGKTKYDVMVRPYTHHAFMDRSNPYLVIEDLRLKPGVQAWVRLRAVNRVGLSTASHGNQPILIDRTPPIVGHVYDGDKLKVDLKYQANANEICAQWLDFFDPESGIASYMWGVGTRPMSDDILQYKTLPSEEKSACLPVSLQHNTTYFSTVIAYNRALNQKNITAVSDGVLVDETAPVSGWVHDGDDKIKDLDYSSETATVISIWDGFSDPESNIADYSVKIYVNEELKGVFDVGKQTSFTDHSVTTKHGDRVKIELEAENGAGLKTVTHTDGYVLDETAPLLVYFDGGKDLSYQADNTKLSFKWEFADPESHLKEYRYKVYKDYEGSKEKIIPKDNDSVSVDLNTKSSMEVDLQFPGLSLEDGARYYVHVTAINNAMISTVEESHGIIIDTSNPEVNNVRIALPGDDEELDDDGNFVVHVKGEALHVTWTAMDPESNILKSSVCLAFSNNGCSQDTDFKSVGIETSTTIDGSLLIKTNENEKYSVFVRVVNGAKLTNSAQSKPIKVIQGDVPGAIFDGREFYQDEDFQQDKSSLATSFSGFESESCGISGYEWAVGTQPFYTDVLKYTDYGLVTTNSSSGFAQIQNTNFDGVKYYASVRAKTGSSCPRTYVVSSSNGLTVDSTPPDISFSYEDNQPVDSNHFNLVNSSSTGILWKAKDNVNVDRYEWAITNMPFAANNNLRFSKMKDSMKINKGSVVDGDTHFLTIRAADKAGNIAVQSSAPVTYDSTEPFVNNFVCTHVISHVKPNIKCTWDAIGDVESTISHLSISVGTEPLLSNIIPSQNLTVTHQRWERDLADELKKGMDKLFITLRVENKVHLHTEVYRQVTIDETPPEQGEVRIVTTIGNQKTSQIQHCQIPVSYIDFEVKNFHDNESDIDRFEAAVGRTKGDADIKDFVKVKIKDGRTTLKNLHLVEGTSVFVTVKIFNKVGLFIMSSSESVSVSPHPQISITDGSTSTDQDAQSDLTTLQGHWSASQPCPAVKVEWAVEDLAGNIVKKFELIPDKGYDFYNDELHLENLKTYINVIRIVDAINRTLTGQSDGISVQIQSPDPGFVNDGLGKDINFQLSTDTLSANWHGFGHNSSKNPSQNIDHFEVAIGNDRRYPDARVNVLNFQNVGLNHSATFHNLKLTKKTKTYYVTVRAYSVAGSFQEAYSNGIKVGFTGEIRAGTIECSSVQSAVDRLGASWSGIFSDIGIREYHVGISSVPQQNDGKTFLCRQIDAMNISADVHGFVDVELDQTHMFTGLSLSHGLSYTVLVIAHDQSGVCLLMQSQPVKIDTSPPTAGIIQIKGEVTEHVMYSNYLNQLAVYLDDFEDEESEIQFYVVTLEEGQECTHQGLTKQRSRTEIAQQRLIHDNKTVFNDILLKPNQIYYISVDAYNPAGLKISVLSKPIKVDVTAPTHGTVHSGTKWKQSVHFQSDTNMIHAVTAVSHDKLQLECENDVHLRSFEVLDNKDFSKDNVVNSTKGISLLLHHDASQKTIEKGAVYFRKIMLTEGNYTVNVKPAWGTNIFTGVSYVSQSNNIYPEHYIDFYRNVKLCSQNASLCLGTENRPFIDYGFNFGILIEHRNKTDKTKEGIMWVQDRFKLYYNSIQLDANNEVNEFKFMLQNKSVLSMPSWDIIFLIDQKQEATFSGLALDSNVSLNIFTWNAQHYVPPVVDPFHPFKTAAVITNVRIPKHVKPLCMYGSPFADPESGLKEIWIGLSNSKNKTANIVPFQLQSNFCDICDKSCEADCPETCHLPYGFLPITLELQNLTLASSSQNAPNNMTRINSTTDFSMFKLPTYFIDIKVKNYAGLVTYSKSNALLVDTTPPHIEYVKCVDPKYSSDEPIQFLGNNDSVSVKWEAGEDISGIVSTYVSIGTSLGKQDIHKDIFVASNKSWTFSGLDGKLIHQHKYFVNVKVENGAGQSSTKSCNFTMDVLPPETKHAKAVLMFPQSLKVSVPSADITNYTDRIGLRWNDTSIKGVQYYEWKIGTSLEGQDIFPLIRIGKRKTRSVGIVSGEMKLDGINKNPGLGEFFQRNMTNVKKEKKKKKEDHFKLEPGRCVYQTLYAVSRSHLYSKIHTQPSCIKRVTDKLIKPGKTHFVLESHQHSDNINQSLTLHFEVDDGGLSVGVLDQSDVESVYGSTASANYVPYIANLNSIRDQLSRYLHNRFVSITKPMFYIAPIPKVNLKKKINLTKSNNQLTSKQTKIEEIALLYWDSGDQQWRSVQEPCGVENRVSLTDTTFNTEICEEIFNNGKVTFVKSDREKRSTNIHSSPRHFIVAVINTGVQNSVPSIVTTNVDGEEDNVLKARIDFEDAEGDNLTFTIKSDPSHGKANISQDGVLYYMPEPDFTGVDKLELFASEVVDAPAVTPNQLSATITIRVENINDAPKLFFQNSSTGLLNSENVDVVDIEVTNDESKHLVGTFWMADVDVDDNLTYHNKFPETSLSSNFSLISLPPPEEDDSQDALLPSYRTISRQQLWLSHLPSYIGTTNVSFIVMDQDSAFSRPIIIQVHVNPHTGDNGLSAVIITVIAVCCIIILAIIAAFSFRYYINSKNKIRDLSMLPDTVADISPNVTFARVRTPMELQSMFEHPHVSNHRNAAMATTAFTGVNKSDQPLTASDLSSEMDQSKHQLSKVEI